VPGLALLEHGVHLSLDFAQVILQVLEHIPDGVKADRVYADSSVPIRECPCFLHAHLYPPCYDQGWGVPLGVHDALAYIWAIHVVLVIRGHKPIEGRVPHLGILLCPEHTHLHLGTEFLQGLAAHPHIGIGD
jgi:hypothetical protein